MSVPELLERVARIIDPDAWHDTLPADGCGVYWHTRRNAAREKAAEAIGAVGLSAIFANNGFANAEQLEIALAAGSRRAKTPKAVECEASQSGGCKPQRPETSMTTLSSHKYSMKGYSGE